MVRNQSLLRRPRALATCDPGTGRLDSRGRQCSRGGKEKDGVSRQKSAPWKPLRVARITNRAFTPILPRSLRQCDGVVFARLAAHTRLAGHTHDQ